MRISTDRKGSTISRNRWYSHRNSLSIHHKPSVRSVFRCMWRACICCQSKTTDQEDNTAVLPVHNEDDGVTLSQVRSHDSLTQSNKLQEKKEDSESPTHLSLSEETPPPISVPGQFSRFPPHSGGEVDEDLPEM